MPFRKFNVHMWLFILGKNRIVSQGSSDGFMEGLSVGYFVGAKDGSEDGSRDGSNVGSRLGSTVGSRAHIKKLTSDAAPGLWQQRMQNFS